MLHVIPSISPIHGGPSSALVVMEQSLSARGINVTTLTTDDDGPGRRLTVNKRSSIGGAARVYCRKWFDTYKVAPGVLPWLWRHVRGFDVVHIHALFSFTSVAAALMARWRGVPYVVRPLGTLNVYGITQRRPWLKFLSSVILERPILRAAAAVHFTSEAERQQAEAFRINFRAVVLPLAVEAGTFTGLNDWQSQHPEFVGRRVILYLSRIDPVKNVESLIKAFASVRMQCEDVSLVIAGAGAPAYVDQLKALAKTSGLITEVIWWGHVEGLDKAALLAAAEVFVLPSFSENFGIAAAEAMLAGVPCILGEGVAIADQARSLGAAIVVEPRPNAIAKAIEDLLGDDAQRRAVGARGREMAEREFSMEATARRLIELYREVSKRKR